MYTAAPAADTIDPPAWVASLVADAACATETRAVLVADAGELRFVSVRIAKARGMEEATFSGAITGAYRDIFAALRRGAGAAPRASTLWPVRFWNHIPGLHDRMGPALDRYMSFNTGRFAAMQEWFGGVSQVRRSVATASGIGHQGDDFVVHCLASITPGTSVENPRQVPAYLYSRRFGPMPPCFARATIAEFSGERSLLIAGTASIRGEESVHIGDLEAQAHETLLNLQAVIGAASGGDAGTPQAGQLEKLREVRVYHPRAEDHERLAAVLARAFPGAAHVQIMRADLCRSELLVEIEGVAQLSQPSRRPDNAFATPADSTP